MLHVTNGESTVRSLREAGMEGSIVAWNDSLGDGPVPETETLEELSELRSRALAGFGWGNYDEIRRKFEARDRALAGYREYPEVVLWFEHDLYDQLQLLQILDWFAREDERGERVSLIQIDRHAEVVPFYGLGQLNGEQLAELWPLRVPVTARHLEIAREGWRAFRAADPAGLVRFARRLMPELPYLGAALFRLFEEYPSTKDGLSRSQRQILLAADGDGAHKGELYRTSQGSEECPFGDSSIHRQIDVLASGSAPALDCTEDRFTLNSHGRRLLGGESDWIRSQDSIDMWIGGTHLNDRDRCWRWSAQHLDLRQG